MAFNFAFPGSENAILFVLRALMPQTSGQIFFSFMVYR